MTARNAYDLGASSSEVRVYSGPPCTVPGPPPLSGSASGNQINLAWTTPSGGPTTGYTLQIATPGRPGGTTGDLGLVNAIAGPASSGTYILRVAAHALSGAGPASHPVTIAVP